MLQFLLEGEQTGGSAFPWSILLIAALFVGMYFLMIRPEKKRERAAQEMRAALQVGDEVTTIGGIIGKVVSIKEETFVLETTRDRTRIRFLVSAIRSVDVKAEEAGAARARAASPTTKKAAEDTAEAKEAAETTAEEAVATEATTEPAEEAVATEATTEPAEEADTKTEDKPE